jgi:Skp family chaperone for outer membrane proteins
MKQSKALGIAVFISMMMTGAVTQAAENQVSTVDTGTLFQSHLVQDGKGQNTEKAAAAVDKAVANLPELNSRLRWAAVKSPAELAEEQKAAQRKTKAIPIIITAADIDKERKAQKRGEKVEKPALISPRPIEPPKITAAPQQPVVPQPVKEPVKAVPAADVWELPPVQPVAAAPQRNTAAQEVVELSPIVPVKAVESVPVETIMDAIVEATSVELVVREIKDDSVVELPAVEPVR